MTRVEYLLRALKLTIAKRRGTRAWMHCPFHDSETPTTFFVRLDGDHAGDIHCFSCKARGSIFDLVMRVRRCDFKEARQFVRTQGKGFEAPRARVRIRERPVKLTRPVFRFPSEIVFDEPLDTWVSGARDYVLGRGFTQEEVTRYRFGYAVDGTLAGRVVIPFYDRRGKPASYSARTFVEEEPKYRTPDERDRANLGVLFGENHWPRLEERDIVFVAEGAIDAISIELSLRRLGIRASIAALGGSDVRPPHVISLATFTHVIVVTDADSAGDRAARVLASSLGRNAIISRLRFSPDANTMLRSDGKRLDELIRKAWRDVHGK